MKVTPEQATQLGCPFKFVPFQAVQETKEKLNIQLPDGQVPTSVSRTITAAASINSTPQGLFLLHCQGPACMMWKWHQPSAGDNGQGIGSCGLASD